MKLGRVCQVHRHDPSPTNRVSVQNMFVLLLVLNWWTICYFFVYTSVDEQNDKNNKIRKTNLTTTKRKSVREMRVDLQGCDLWKIFHEIGTEMIITKTGR